MQIRRLYPGDTTTLTTPTMTVRLGPLGDQTVLGAGLIAIGAVVVMSSAFTLLRVLLSIFVLPGKSVSMTSLGRSWTGTDV